MTDKTLTVEQLGHLLSKAEAGVRRDTLFMCDASIAERMCRMALRSLDAEGVRVPREPIPEMIQAWHDRMIEGATYIDRRSIEYALYVECYKAMLAAAPEGKEEGWPTKR